MTYFRVINDFYFSLGPVNVAVRRGRFKSFLFKCEAVVSDGVETVDHIIFDCPSLPETRDKLRASCMAQDIEFTLQNLFARPKIQRNIEEFLYDLFHEKFKPKTVNILQNCFFELLDTVDF
jgi:hypothetical protein